MKPRMEYGTKRVGYKVDIPNKGRISLPNFKGILTILPRGYEGPMSGDYLLWDVTLFHENCRCGGLIGNFPSSIFNLARVSETMRVLFCNQCGSSFELPISVITVDDLLNHF